MILQITPQTLCPIRRYPGVLLHSFLPGADFGTTLPQTAAHSPAWLPQKSLLSTAPSQKPLLLTGLPQEHLLSTSPSQKPLLLTGPSQKSLLPAGLLPPAARSDSVLREHPHTTPDTSQRPVPPAAKSVPSAPPVSTAPVPSSDKSETPDPFPICFPHPKPLDLTLEPLPYPQSLDPTQQSSYHQLPDMVLHFSPYPSSHGTA